MSDGVKRVFDSEVPIIKKLRRVDCRSCRLRQQTTDYGLRDEWSTGLRTTDY